MDTRHLDSLRQELKALRVITPPQPWRKISVIAVGGLRAVGFDRDSELLLALSSAGRGVIDCQSGLKVARDDAEYYEHELILEAEGIGPLERSTIRVSGLHGGGLPRGTSDGWSIETVYLNWPVAETLLLEPFASLYDSLRGKPSCFYRISSESEMRASGFSYSGRTLVIATSSNITIYGRDGG